MISPQGEQIQPAKKPKSKEELEELNDRLSYAARRGQFEDINICLNEGADINTKAYNERTPLWNTVYWNRSDSNEIIALLLEKGADIEIPNGDGETPLWRAVAEGKKENVQLLLRWGSKVNAKDNRGVSVLHRAVSKANSKTTFQVIFAHGLPDTHALAAERYTPHGHTFSDGKSTD